MILAFTSGCSILPLFFVLFVSFVIFVFSLRYLKNYCRHHGANGEGSRYQGRR